MGKGTQRREKRVNQKREKKVNQKTEKKNKSEEREKSKSVSTLNYGKGELTLSQKDPTIPGSYSTQKPKPTAPTHQPKPMAYNA